MIHPSPGNAPSARLGRRSALIAVGALAALAYAGQPRAQVKTRARILILGAGAAGLTAANRLARQLDGAEITLLDRRREHHYQPGYTLVAAGLRNPGYTLSATAEYLPRNSRWIEEQAADIDPVGRIVVTDAGRRLPYDFLIVATGLDLNYAAIEGMEVSRIGQDGLGSMYAGPEQAQATWRAMSAFADRGGVGLFGRPASEMKCAGAPLKYAFLTEDRLRRTGQRSRAEVVFNAHNRTLFGVPIVAERVRMIAQERGITVNHDHVMTGIDLGRKIAIYRTPTGTRELRYDFINVVPPMRATDAVRNSPLRWQTGPFAADGWAEVDRHTLRHVRFPEVFCVGDVAGVPRGKTAASVKWQVPVAVDHLVASIEGRQSAQTYNGYTSCPLITRYGRALLVEFDYDGNLVSSFPGIIAPLEELWISWAIKEIGLKPTYLAMLRGRA